MIMRQLQSVAALAFIAVLIILLLILTVMVHMRNRKLKSMLEEQMAERRLLDKICADFTAVYYVELNTGSFEILHINDGTNVKKMNLKQCDNFNYSADQYAVQYLYEKETTIQNQLKQALDEARLSNEIISAIAKSYCSIYRIDVHKDFFEEISNDSEIHKLTGNRGSASEKLYQLCDTMVASEYRSLIRPFLDVSTLSARLKAEECISTEYRMCDGSWHRMLFTVKKRDESGNVTHVLCTVRSISDSKRREEDLNFAAEAAKREAEMKTRFLATMSHDIRTPLNGIIGMVNMGNQYADDPQMQQKIREKAMESLKYLVSLVNDVLDMFGVTEDDIAEEAKNLVNRRLFISAYAEANNIEVTEDEYVNYVNEYADYYGESPADFETLYTRETLVNALYESKVTELLLEKANVTETPYTPEEYDEEESKEDDTLDDLEIVEEGEEGVAE